MSYHRRNFALINPNQQLKVIFLVNILCFAVFTMYPVVLFFVFKNLEPDSYLTNEIKEHLFLKLLGFFLLFQIIFQLIISYIFITYTKKLSSPVEKLGSFLESLVDGRDVKIAFADDEFFQDLGPVFKMLKKREENKRRVIVNLEREIESLLDQEDQESKRNALFFLKSEASSLK